MSRNSLSQRIRCLAGFVLCSFLSSHAADFVGQEEAGERLINADLTPKETVGEMTTKAFRDGSMPAGRIQFSGYTWQVKASHRYVGPGPNRFSSSTNNVWVDDEGRLHLRITKERDEWRCAEVVMEKPVGYGTYRFYSASRIDQLDANVVLGFFTWDDDTYKSMANCELDIEWARWGDPTAPNLHYSVQPVWGPDEPGGKYKERSFPRSVELSETRVLDVFEWRPEAVRFATYDGHEAVEGKLLAEWRFDEGNPHRRTQGSGGWTSPVGIPAPGPGTRVRINLWLLDGDRSGRGDAPTDGMPVEVVIERFEFIPAD